MRKILTGFLFNTLFFISILLAEEKINVSLELKNLKSKNMTKKLESIEKLAKTKDKVAINELIVQLKTEKSPVVKTRIVEAFSHCHDSDTVQETINLLNTEKNFEVRYAAVYSLGYAKDPSVVPLLINIFLNEEEPLGIRLQAASSLVNYPPTEQIYECFVRGLENQNANIRAQSIVSLAQSYGSFYPQKVAALLKKLTEDKDEKVSKTAQQYLEFLGIK